MSSNFHIENEGNSKEINENLNTNSKRQKDLGAFVEKFMKQYSQHARKRLSV